MSPRLDSLCLFEAAPFGGGLGVRRVSLFGFSADSDGEVLDLEEMTARIQAQLDQHQQLAHRVAEELAQLPEPPPDAPPEAPAPAPSAVRLVEPTRRSPRPVRDPDDDINAEQACDAKARPCLDCDGGRSRAAKTLGCLRCGGRGVRVWSHDVEVTGGWQARHEPERVAIAAALANALAGLPPAARAGARELLELVLLGAKPATRVRALAWWQPVTELVSDLDAVDDDADVAEEARDLEAAARAELQEPAAGEQLAATPADAGERVLELVADPPPVRFHDAIARPCLRCNGGRRRIHGGCALCQQRGVRAWVDGCEVGLRVGWKVASEPQRSAVVAALADALPELPETAVRGALDLLNIVLRGAPPEARTAALRRWDESRLMIGAA